MKNRAFLQALALPAALIAVAVFFALREPAFLGSRNLTQLLIEFAMVGTLALGMFLMAVSPELKFIARGTVLALAVWMDVRFARA